MTTPDNPGELEPVQPYADVPEDDQLPDDSPHPELEDE
jgi:hypothetical protein